jgi:catechol 2,3-dioxygenase-like lactoylglutathione lyase family enzyme
MASTLTNAGVRFGRAMIMVRGAEGVAQSVNFYQNALGMNVLRHTDDWAELACPVASPAPNADADVTTSTVPVPVPAPTPKTSNFLLSIKSVESEAQLGVGYSPFLSFDVDDMDGTVARCAQMGAHLDGPIQYPAHGKVATLRAPDGQMIGLYEPAI